MAADGLKWGMACSAGACTLFCLANLCGLIAKQKARQRAEARRDPFFDKQQVVVDLVSLMTADQEAVRRALSDKAFQTPVSDKMIEAFHPGQDPEWQCQFLNRKTYKTSYDDLMVIERALQQAKIPYTTRVRENPVRKMIRGRDVVLTHPMCHRDLVRHMLLRVKRDLDTAAERDG